MSATPVPFSLLMFMLFFYLPEIIFHFFNKLLDARFTFCVNHHIVTRYIFFVEHSHTEPCMRNSCDVLERETSAVIKIDKYVKFFIDEIPDGRCSRNHLPIELFAGKKIDAKLCKLILRQYLFVHKA